DQGLGAAVQPAAATGSPGRGQQEVAIIQSIQTGAKRRLALRESCQETVDDIGYRAKYKGPPGRHATADQCGRRVGPQERALGSRRDRRMCCCRAPVAPEPEMYIQIDLLHDIGGP